MTPLSFVVPSTGVGEEKSRENEEQWERKGLVSKTYIEVHRSKLVTTHDWFLVFLEWR